MSNDKSSETKSDYKYKIHLYLKHISKLMGQWEQWLAISLADIEDTSKKRSKGDDQLLFVHTKMLHSYTPGRCVTIRGQTKKILFRSTKKHGFASTAKVAQKCPGNTYRTSVQLLCSFALPKKHRKITILEIVNLWRHITSRGPTVSQLVAAPAYQTQEGVEPVWLWRD